MVMYDRYQQLNVIRS